MATMNITISSTRPLMMQAETLIVMFIIAMCFSCCWLPFSALAAPCRASPRRASPRLAVPCQALPGLAVLRQ
jgi:hypothetical protein